ncbi:hypothetical protein PFISCL1PPCAC_10952, partial [Pristionchus fissidentatus]
LTPSTHINRSIMPPSPTDPATPSPDSTHSDNPKPDIGTLEDKNEDYTGPPKKVSRKLRRRSKKSRRSRRKIRSKEERRRAQEVKNMRRLKTKRRDDDIVAETAPGSVQNESRGDAVDEGTTEDYLNGLLEGSSSAAPVSFQEYEDEDLSEAPPIVRLIKAVSNLVAYLMNHPIVPVAVGVALLVVITSKL